MPFIPFDEMGVTPEKTKTFGDVSKFIPDKVQVDMNTKVKPSLLSKVTTSLKTGVNNAKVSTSGTDPNNTNPIVGGFQGAADIAGGVMAAGNEVFKSGLSRAKSNADKMFGGNPIYDVAKASANIGIDNAKKLADAAGKVGVDISNQPWVASLGQFLNENPNGTKLLEDTLKILSASGEISNLALAARGAVAGGSKAVSASREVLSSTKSVLSEAAVKTPSLLEKGQSLQSLSDRISPKLGAKETRLAMEEGRLFKGDSEGGFFKKGRPDKVAASPQQAKSTFTIERLIPEHASLDDATFYTTIKEKIGTISSDLKPEMQKISIKSKTVSKITDDFKRVRESQVKNAPANEEVNVIKIQDKFEQFLKKSKSDNMNDLWETRQAYDDSVLARVKQANELSSESLQLQKDIWLENRRILSDAINDTKDGLGLTSQKAFSDMTDLYEAKKGLLSKANIETEGAQSTVGKIMDSRKGKVIKAGVKAVGAGVGLNLLP